MTVDIRQFAVDCIRAVAPDGAAIEEHRALGPDGLGLGPDALRELTVRAGDRCGARLSLPARLESLTVGEFAEAVAACDGGDGHPWISRDAVVALLATYRDRTAAEVHERIDSLELAWLVHQVEQRYAVRLDLDDDQFARMTTVTSAVDVLAGAAPAGARKRGVDG